MVLRRAWKTRAGIRFRRHARCRAAERQGPAGIDPPRHGLPAQTEERTMITIYKTGEQGIEVIDEVVKGCWINVVDPTPEELIRLRELCTPADFITYPLDLDERPRVEKDESETLILLRVPYAQDPNADVPYTTIPMGIVMDGQWIMTVCRYDHEMLREMAAGKVRGLTTAKRNRFILQLLLNAAQKYLAYLREINKNVDILEDRLHMATRNRELLGLLKYQKSLVYFTTALKANELMMERLHRSGFFRTYPDDEDLLEDVITENQQAIEMTNIASNILSSMMDAFASIISNNMNIVMKFLAAATIVIALPTLFTSFYGMNVDLPGQGNPLTYFVILAACLGVALFMIRLFIRRDWM
jgi:magnesium transporter